MSTEAATDLPYDLRLRRKNLAKALERLDHDLGLAEEEALDLEERNAIPELSVHGCLQEARLQLGPALEALAIEQPEEEVAE